MPIDPDFPKNRHVIGKHDCSDGEHFIWGPGKVVVFITFSISIHFTSIHPLYNGHERPTTNNPITTAASFMTLLHTQLLHQIGIHHLLRTQCFL
jgi:hypothetical protein